MGNETSKSSKRQEAPTVAEPTPVAKDTGAEYKELASRLVDINIPEIVDRTVIRGRNVARVIDMHDGDTLDVAYTNEAGRLERVRIRVAGYDTPEMDGCTAAAGQLAKNEALTFLDAEGAHNLRDGEPIREWFAKHPTFLELDFETPRLRKGKFDKTPEKFRRTIAHVRVPVRSHQSFSRLEGRIALRGLRPLNLSPETTLATYLIYMGMAKKYGGGTKDQSLYEGESFKPPVECPVEEQRRSFSTLKDQFMAKKHTDGYKGETDREQAFVEAVWDLIEDQGNEAVQDEVVMIILSGDYGRFDRKRIVRYIRDNKDHAPKPIDFLLAS